jgi:hypothetical protein
VRRRGGRKRAIGTRGLTGWGRLWILVEQLTLDQRAAAMRSASTSRFELKRGQSSTASNSRRQATLHCSGITGKFVRRRRWLRD